MITLNTYIVTRSFYRYLTKKLNDEYIKELTLLKLKKNHDYIKNEEYRDLLIDLTITYGFSDFSEMLSRIALNSINERYMLLMFIANSLGSKNSIIMPIKSIMEYFQCKGKEKIIGILKSLESKGYIQIIKECGKVNKYRIIKCNSYEQSSSEIVTGTDTYKETSSKNMTSNTQTCKLTSTKNMTGYTEFYDQTSAENMTSTSTSGITGIDESEGGNFKGSIENTGFAEEVISLDHKRKCYSNVK